MNKELKKTLELLHGIQVLLELSELTEAEYEAIHRRSLDYMLMIQDELKTYDPKFKGVN